MAIDRSDRYPGRFDVPTLAQPQGAFKNKTGPAAVDGTYLEKDWANDFAGFFSSLLQGVSANGSVDEVGASQYYDAMLNSQTYTGIPRAPTASQGTSTTQIATTAFVDNAAEVVIGSNSSGFYRIRTADGYIEQFGTAITSSGSSTAMSFPVAFSNTDYAFEGQIIVTGQASQSPLSISDSTIATTGLSVSVFGLSGSYDYFWSARGY